MTACVSAHHADLDLRRIKICAGCPRPADLNHPCSLGRDCDCECWRVARAGLQSGAELRPNADLKSQLGPSRPAATVLPILVTGLFMLLSLSSPCDLTTAHTSMHAGSHASSPPHRRLTARLHDLHATPCLPLLLLLLREEDLELAHSGRQAEIDVKIGGTLQHRILLPVSLGRQRSGAVRGVRARQIAKSGMTSLSQELSHECAWSG